MATEPQIGPTLDPCPFCMGTEDVRLVSRAHQSRVVCEAPGCDVVGPDGSDDAEAVAKWNDRKIVAWWIDALKQLAASVERLSGGKLIIGMHHDFATGKVRFAVGKRKPKRGKGKPN